MDPFTLIMLAVLALLIFFMFRNSRKRQADARALQSKVGPGAQVMLNFGVFGTIISMDEEENQVLVETTPGTVLTVHRQTVARVIDPVEVPADDAIESVSLGDETEPEFGERRDDVDTGDGHESKKSDD